MDILGSFRKLIVSPTGSAIYFALGSAILQSLLLRVVTPTSLMILAGGGAWIGYNSALKFREKAPYLVRNIENDRYYVTQKFNKLLQQRKLPDSADEYDEFREYLDAVQQTHTQSKSSQAMLCGIMCVLALIVVAAIQIKLTSLFFIAVAFLIIYITTKNWHKRENAEYLQGVLEQQTR